MKRIILTLFLIFFVLLFVNCSSPDPDSENNNITFSNPINITNTSNMVSNSTMVLDNSGNIIFLWQEKIPADNWEIMFIRSTDKGSTWSVPVNISNNAALSVSPEISFNSVNDLYVVWDDSTPGNREIFFIRSTDNGLTWSSPLNISKTNTDGSYLPSIALSSTGIIYVVWMEWNGDRDIFFSRSTDNGNTWSLPVIIYNDTGLSIGPEIIDDGIGNLYVVWEDMIAAKSETFFSRSTDNGSNWSLPVNISNNNGSSYGPKLSTDSLGNLNVAWIDTTPGNWDIFFNRSTDSGTTWSLPINISNNPGKSTGYDIATDNFGKINFSWSDNTSGGEILFSRSTDNGATWSSALNISGVTANLTSAEITVDSAGNIYMMWFDNNSGIRELYFCRSIQ
ncbi:MAG: exo-alpha-sialidase [Candidatus Aminicenantes bacterium]|nr:exo-alpha-sialidase [Candidatus Aminicenantes bacterium]